MPTGNFREKGSAIESQCRRPQFLAQCKVIARVIQQQTAGLEPSLNETSCKRSRGTDSPYDL